MRQSPLTREQSNLDATIQRLSAMFYCTSSREHCPGKDYLADLKTKSMLLSRRRRLTLPSLSFVKVTPPNFRSSWSTVVPSSLSRSPTTNSASASSKTAYLVIITMPRSSTTLGSKTDYLKIKRISRPKCSESQARRRSTTLRRNQNKKLSMDRPTVDMRAQLWETPPRRPVSREDPS